MNRKPIPSLAAFLVCGTALFFLPDFSAAQSPAPSTATPTAAVGTANLTVTPTGTLPLALTPSPTPTSPSTPTAAVGTANLTVTPTGTLPLILTPSPTPTPTSTSTSTPTLTPTATPSFTPTRTSTPGVFQFSVSPKPDAVGLIKFSWGTTVPGEEAFLKIFTSGFRVVREFYFNPGENPEFLASGLHEITWNGKDENSRPMPPGTYLCFIDIKVGTKKYEASGKTEIP